MTLESRRTAFAQCFLSAPLLAACAAVGPQAPGPAQATPHDDDWQLVWADDFDGNAIDAERWNLIEDCWGGGNNEQQCYTARPSNVSVEDGALVITARDEDFTGPAWPAHFSGSSFDTTEQATKPFTSAKLTTQGLADWTYGRFEMRARLPQGQGVWPAFWMLPADDRYGGWPEAGEIDILEAVNLGVECDTCEAGGESSILGTLHYGGDGDSSTYTNREIVAPQVLDGDFHVYGAIWEKGRISWTLDGEVFGTIEASDWYTVSSDDPEAPFDQPFYLILNLAIGGNWPESTALGGVSIQGFPKQMEIDWVRVWQCEADAATGRGCTGD